MSAIESLAPPAAPRRFSKFGVGEMIVLAMMAPMIASGVLFPTYDIAMASLPLEILRQLNVAFVACEILVILYAGRRGFRAADTVARLDLVQQIALGVFVATFAWGGALFSQAAPFATLFNLTYLVHFLFAGAVAHLARSMRPAETAAMARIVTVTLVAFAAMIAARFLVPPPGRAIDSIAWQFAIPGFISVRLFGAMAAAWAAAALYLSLTTGDRGRARVWTLAFVVMTCGMVVWSGTRAGVMGVGVAGLVALICFRLRPRLDAILTTTLAVVIGSGLAWLLLPHGDTDFWLFTPTDYAGTADGFTSGRLALWSETLKAILEVPLFGAGPGASAWMVPIVGNTHIQPHNIVLQFLISWGLVASCAAFVMLVGAVWAVHRRARMIAAAIPYVLVADCLLAMSFVDGTFHFAQHLMIWMAMMGIALSIRPADHDLPPG